MTLQDFRDLLLETTDKVYHFEGFPEGERRYILWWETGISHFFADNELQELVNLVRVEVHTNQEFDGIIYELLEKMDKTGSIAWKDPTITWDNERMGLVYTVDCEVA